MAKTTVSLKYFFLSLYALTTIYPFFWIFTSSLKPNTDIFSKPFALPAHLNFANYVKVLTKAHLGTNFMNSLYICVFSVFIAVLVGSMAAYILARVKPSLILYTYFTLGIMIPIQTILIPSFILLKQFDLINTHLGLIIEYVVGRLPLTIFIMVAFMKTLPKEMEEAALIDGCGRARTFFSIVLPLSKPGLATVATLSFLDCWNEYLFAYVLISSTKLKVITQAIYALRGQYITDYGLLCAGLALMMIPVILMYILFQEQVIKGMTAGAVKG
ncbi:carbohydrate ABC transporter permease [Paenibacillus psychroresistens]|uniref:Carbohydrate ABC transporter permease n=1 Tax=Paenibacillus psychroresistens TaxID=1778678 RepID=A0A6B8RGF2_9BACL|nr:carbohydrate ABC transporter permease [Paenibacillus psychroresistens]QGQ95017.1 carbohydrate ABC transporter permease [Paenibacillus psychroresistens]